MALLQSFIGPGLPLAAAVIALKSGLLALYLAVAVVLFRHEALLVAARVSNKFSRK